MCNEVVSKSIENQFQLFAYLKLGYPSGKIKFTQKELLTISFTLQVTPQTIKNNIKKLLDLQWIEYDEYYKYYRVKSFDKLRENNNWEQRRAVPLFFNQLSYTRAFLGAVLYLQLYKNYCRKNNRKRHVLKSESANKPLSSSYHKQKAQISVKSIKQIFKTSICKASRLKKLAANMNLLEVEKQYFKLSNNQVYAAKKSAQYREENINIIFREDGYYIQLIDLIYTDMFLKRRKKLETL